MLLNAVTIKDYFAPLKAGDQFEFRNPITVLCGEGRCGKSALMKIMKYRPIACDYNWTMEPEHICFYDGLYKHESPKRTMERLEFFFSKSPAVMLLDNPDAGMNCSNVIKLLMLFKRAIEKGHQIITTLQPMYYYLFDELYNMDQRKFITLEEWTDLVNPLLAGFNETSRFSNKSK